MLPGIELTNGHVHLVPGEHLVLYTDGVTEAQDLELNEFGDDRLLAEIKHPDDCSKEGIHRRIHAAIQEFVGDAPQFDYLALLVVGRD